jgi:hypothetical protein
MRRGESPSGELNPSLRTFDLSAGMIRFAVCGGPTYRILQVANAGVSAAHRTKSAKSQKVCAVGH